MRLGWWFMSVVLWILLKSVSGAEDTRRLFEDLLSNYNKLIRPRPPQQQNGSRALHVKFKMRLSQLLDVHEKNQIVTTNVWLEHVSSLEWVDPNLSWDPTEYGGAEVLYVPSEMIWLPDIILYNNADGNYQVTIMTKASVHYTGRVSWNPPAIYKSMCPINVQWFPFDLQECSMKFGCWTYDGLYVDLSHKTNDTVFAYTIRTRDANNQIETANVQCVENGIDLSDYYRSVEWDIIAVPGWKRSQKYPCCPEPYIDITYKIILRRKTLFYTVNLMVPCIGISFLTMTVFYLPNDSGEKVTLAISILISLTVFFLLLVEIIPATSVVVPLIGKYLIFTMVMVTISITVSVVIINVHYRTSATTTMSAFTRRWFLERLPKLLCMERPADYDDFIEHSEHIMRDNTQLAYSGSNQQCFRQLRTPLNSATTLDGQHEHSLRLTKQANGYIVNGTGTGDIMHDTFFVNHHAATLPVGVVSRTVHDHKSHVRSAKPKTAHCVDCRSYERQVGQAMTDVQYIAHHLRRQYINARIGEDWKFVALVIDRIFLVAFCVACFVGTAMIIFQAPTLYDARMPIDEQNAVQHDLHELNGISYCRLTAAITNSPVQLLQQYSD